MINVDSKFKGISNMFGYPLCAKCKTGSNCAKHELGWHLCGKSHGRLETCAMIRDDIIGGGGFDIRNRPLNQLRFRPHQMEPPYDRMYFLTPGYFLRLFNGICDSSVGATGKNNRTFSFNIQYYGLLSNEEILLKLPPPLL